jgi:hypothetical protein
LSRRAAGQKTARFAPLRHGSVLLVLVRSLQPFLIPSRRPCGRPPAAALFTAEATEGSGDRTGLLVEFDKTDTLFTHPADKRTEDYVTGRFG